MTERRDGLRGAAARFRALAARFWRNTEGGTIPLFAITLGIMLGAAALVLDYGYATTVKTRQQAALDASTLAASDVLGTQNAQTRGDTIAGAFYKANTKRNPTGTIEKLTLDEAGGKVASKGNTTVNTVLMRLFGIKQVPVRGKSVIARASGTVEVALVLDNSGSMWSEMDNLKKAAKEMAGILFVGSNGTEKVRVGLVPFAASVNVGPHNASAFWIDANGYSPVHFENFAGSRTRFQVFGDMGVNWAGCVEVRPSPYDVSDAYPASGNPATLFVPMFAPDEPDKSNAAGASYPNDYLNDDGGSCDPQPKRCIKYSRRGNCREWEVDPIPAADAQSRLCKYSGQSPSRGTGPNYNCTTAAILPLTSTKAELETAIEGMTANGWTNILQGTTWGWRVLSSAAPFTEGRDEGDSNNRKYLVIMSDGENTYQSQNNHNKSMYGAFSYTSKARLPISGAPTKMNEKTLTACDNAKAAGITIFTVAFRAAATSYAARSLLQSCATSPSHALLASNGEALKKAFQDIGRQISRLRIAG